MGLAKIIKTYNKKEKIISLALLAMIIISLFLIFRSTYKFVKPQSDQSMYTEGVVGELTSTNPLYRDYSRVNRDLSSLVFSGLTKYNPEKNSFDPDLANFEINNNSTVFTFHLKDNLKWQDGEPLTIDDVLYTYKAVIQHEKFDNAIIKENFNGVEIEITAENEITFTLKKPNSFFISNTNIPILPRHIWTKVDIENMSETNLEEKIIGSGPFEVKDITIISPSLTQIILNRSKQYSGEIPKIKNLKLLAYKSNEELLLNQSRLDSIPNLPHIMKNQIDTDLFKTEEYILPQYSAIFINTEKDLLKQKLIRDMLNKASNKKVLAESLPSKQLISGPYFQISNSDVQNQPTNKQIRERLESEGWTLNNENIYEKDGQKLEFELTIQNFPQNKLKDKENHKVSQHFIDSYAKVGIKITPRYLDKEVYSNVLQRKNFQLILAGHSLGNNFDTYSFWHSSQGGINGSNLSNYKSIAADKLLEDLRNSNNNQTKRGILEALNQKLNDDIPAIFLFTEKQLFAFDNKIKKRKILKSYAFTSDRFYQISQWLLK